MAILLSASTHTQPACIPSRDITTIFQATAEPSAEAGADASGEFQVAACSLHVIIPGLTTHTTAKKLYLYEGLIEPQYAQ